MTPCDRILRATRETPEPTSSVAVNLHVDEARRQDAASAVPLLVRHAPLLKEQLLGVQDAAPAHPQVLPCSVVRAFKARYRCRLLGKLAAVRSSEAGLSLGQAAARITVLDALHMAAAAWARVPPQLIWGSFVQEGLAPCKTAPAPSRACEMPPVPGGLSPEEFSRFVDLEGEDPGPGVCKEEAVAEEEEGAGAGAEAREPPPTKADALQALRTLRRWLECNGTGPELLDQFYGCEEGVERLCCL